MIGSNNYPVLIACKNRSSDWFHDTWFWLVRISSCHYHSTGVFSDFASMTEWLKIYLSTHPVYGKQPITPDILQQWYKDSIKASVVRYIPVTLKWWSLSIRLTIYICVCTLSILFVIVFCMSNAEIKWFSLIIKLTVSHCFCDCLLCPGQ